MCVCLRVRLFVCVCLFACLSVWVARLYFIRRYMIPVNSLVVYLTVSVVKLVITNVAYTVFGVLLVHDKWLISIFYVT